MTAFFSYSWFKFKNKISLNLILFYYFWIQNFKMQLSSESKNISNPEQWKKQKNKKKKIPWKFSCFIFLCNSDVFFIFQRIYILKKSKFPLSCKPLYLIVCLSFFLHYSRRTIVPSWNLSMNCKDKDFPPLICPLCFVSSL